MKKYFYLLLAAIALTSCSGYKTHGKFITEQKDAWMYGYVVDEKGKETDKNDDADQGLVYCRANPKEDGTASPVCYRAKFK